MFFKVINLIEFMRKKNILGGLTKARMQSFILNFNEQSLAEYETLHGIFNAQLLVNHALYLPLGYLAEVGWRLEQSSESLPNQVPCSFSMSEGSI